MINCKLKTKRREVVLKCLKKKESEPLALQATGRKS